ncbi:MAG TPA: GNAT family N-acetyltransferase [Candidatus Acidoferrales bacterium]|nr:GNAT family N-acetyltransferase [Candidatus Acidoferrales bacterium]
MHPDLQLRLATLADVPALINLIELSVRGLQEHDYSANQIELALKHVYGVDTQLISDGTYFGVEAVRCQTPLLVGCGGWSKRKTLFGGDAWNAREDSLLDPCHDAAKIRAFFVHPDWARHGLGTMILGASEAAARAAGFARCEMGATLTGVPFYRKNGYAELEPVEVPLPGGASLPIIRMEKNL